MRRTAEREKHELETRLYRAQKLESLGLLAGGIAHDFANLLTVILTSTSLASARSQDPLVNEELNAITGAAERGALLTRQLLAISRTHPLTLQAVDLGERLRSLASLAPPHPARSGSRSSCRTTASRRSPKAIRRSSIRC